MGLKLRVSKVFPHTAHNANYEQLNADITIPGTAWTLAQVNDTSSKRLKIGWINANTAISIGIIDATDYMQVIHIPWSSAYPSQILLTASGKQRMYYRTCGSGTWQTPHLLTTKDDLTKHFPSSGNIQTGPAGEYPRVGLIKNGNNLHLRLQTAENTYREIVITETGVTAAKVDNGTATNKVITSF